MKNKQKIIFYGRKLLEKDLVKGTWGNISLKEGGFVYITPSGLDYDKISENDISVVNIITDETKEGKKRSSEYLLHKMIYEVREDIKAIIHTHSPFLTAISILGDDIPPLVEDQVMIIGEKIKRVSYALAGSEELAKKVSVVFKDGLNGAMLANHGYVAGGKTLEEAFNNCLIAEKSAQIYLGIKPFYHDGMKIPEKDLKKLIEVYKNYYSGG